MQIWGFSIWNGPHVVHLYIKLSLSEKDIQVVLFLAINEWLMDKHKKVIIVVIQSCQSFIQTFVSEEFYVTVLYEFELNKRGLFLKFLLWKFAFLSVNISHFGLQLMTCLSH